MGNEILCHCNSTTGFVYILRNLGESVSLEKTVFDLYDGLEEK